MAKPPEISSQEDSENLKEIEQELVKVNPKIFEGVHPRKKFEFLRSLSVTLMKYHSGPLPPAEDLQLYNEIIPNGADRIMKMAEKQQDHRIAMEVKVVGRQTFQSQLGQIFALIIGLAAIGAAVYTINQGHDWAGAVLGAGGVTGLVTAFIQGKKDQRRSLAEKNR